MVIFAAVRNSQGNQMRSRFGLSSPVIVSRDATWCRDSSEFDLGHLLSRSDDQLAAVDPLVMNLIVAKGVPSLADLSISHYQDIVNGWASDFVDRCLPVWEPHFHRNPHDFKNDIRYFRLGMVCQYLELEVGIEYNRDQRELQGILYTNPSDLFLNGVLDTHQGTCGNMAALQMAMGWRLGWPVSLACVNSHFILRYDDGETVYNIEATQSGYGGFKSDPDDYLIETKHLPPIAIESGSDLRALRPSEVLGVFIGLRARHFRDVGVNSNNRAILVDSERDWLLARYLFPTNRVLYKHQMAVSSMRGYMLFERHEAGHPDSYSACLNQIQQAFLQPTSNGEVQALTYRTATQPIDEYFFQVEANP